MFLKAYAGNYGFEKKWYLQLIIYSINYAVLTLYFRFSWAKCMGVFSTLDSLSKGNVTWSTLSNQCGSEMTWMGYIQRWEGCSKCQPDQLGSWNVDTTQSLTDLRLYSTVIWQEFWLPYQPRPNSSPWPRAERLHIILPTPWAIQGLQF